MLGVTFRLAGTRCRRRSATASWPGCSVSAKAGGCRSPTSARPCSRCAAARGWCWIPADPDTRSAGSFFTNPVLGHGQFAEVQRRAVARAARAGRTAGEVSVPHFPAGDGQVKVPAAWLIEQAGFGKGYPGTGGARISSKHTLALINPGGASSASLVGLAREIRNGVRQAFGVELVNEPVLVGAEL